MFLIIVEKYGVFITESIIKSISFESIKNFKGLNFLDIYFRICPLWTVDHREIENIFFCFEFILRVNLHKILKPHFWSTG